MAAEVRGLDKAWVRNASLINDAGAELDVRHQHSHGFAQAIPDGRVQPTGRGCPGQAEESRKERYEQASSPPQAPVGWQRAGGVVAERQATG